MNRRSLLSSAAAAIGCLVGGRVLSAAPTMVSGCTETFSGGNIAIKDEDAIRRSLGYIEQGMREAIASGHTCTHRAWSAAKPIQAHYGNDFVTCGGGYSIEIECDPADEIVKRWHEQAAVDGKLNKRRDDGPQIPQSHSRSFSRRLPLGEYAATTAYCSAKHYAECDAYGYAVLTDTHVASAVYRLEGDILTVTAVFTTEVIGDGSLRFAAINRAISEWDSSLHPVTWDLRKKLADQYGLAILPSGFPQPMYKTGDLGFGHLNPAAKAV